jgi:hypothetical protein
MTTAARLLCALMRLTGRLWIAVADEIDRAVTVERVHAPATVPEWMNEEADLP